MVELNDGFVEDDARRRRSRDAASTASTPASPAAADVTAGVRPRSQARRIDRRSGRRAGAGARRRAGTGRSAARRQAEGVRRRRPASSATRPTRAGRCICATSNRSCAQAEGGFDERRYGFGGLMDLLQACQREGLRPRRARSPRRPARVPGLGAAGRAAAPHVSRPEPAAAGRRRVREPSRSRRAAGRCRSTPATAADGEQRRRSSRCRSTRPRSCSAAPSRASRAPARSRVRAGRGAEESGGEEAGAPRSRARQEGRGIATTSAPAGPRSSRAAEDGSLRSLRLAVPLVTSPYPDNRSTA